MDVRFEAGRHAMIRPVLQALAGAAVLLAVGAVPAGSRPTEASEASSRSQVAPASRTAAAARRGTTIRAVRSEYGTILADGRGQAVYVFARETTSRPKCYGACAKAWPPVLTKGGPVAGKGARATLLGTTRRRDGTRQVTVDGKPLYSYVHDTPGRVRCHDVREFGGLWLVVRPDGTPAP